MPSQTDVLVIGGGVIGVCSAYYLAQAGARVTLVDKGDICSGASYGNAGLIVPSHSIPLAKPGVVGQGLVWLLDPESPFYIKPRLDPDLFIWLWRFALASRGAVMRRSIPTLLKMSLASIALYDELARADGIDCDYNRNGLLLVFNTRPGHRDCVEEAHLLQEKGLTLEILDAEAARAIEPSLKPSVLGAIHYQGDAHLNPAHFVRGLARQVEKLGGCLLTGAEVTGIETAGRKITKVSTTSGDFKPEQVALAAGAWSPAVARDLQHLRLPIQAAKGYSVTIDRPERNLERPVLLSEARVAVTPMGSLLRFAGTLELAGLNLTINGRRVDAIVRGVRQYLRGLDDFEPRETWSGLRPVTPDGLPILGRTRAYENLIVAAGHAMIGQSLGPITGKLVAQIACGAQTALDVTPLRAERFG
jgi:D-amino-acid dehydrogenase